MVTAYKKYPPSEFTYLKKVPNLSSPCPICGGTRTNCRITKEGPVMCAQHLGPAPAGYKLSEKLARGYWQIFYPERAEKTAEEQAEWEAYQAKRRQETEQAEATFQKRVLSPETRNTHYSKLLEATTLGEVAMQDLGGRGVNIDSAVDWGFRSVDAGHDVSALGLPNSLPGVEWSGERLYNTAGYLCPIKDPAGNLTGFQIRKNGGGYRWLSAPKATQDLANHEWPLNVARPLTMPHELPRLGNMGETKIIGMCEGILKPFIAAQNLGQIVIGAAGGMFPHSAETLKAYLLDLLMEVNFEHIVFYPDAGAIKNPSVLLQYFRTWELIEEWGFSLKVCWYGQSSKDKSAHNNRDIDEFSGSELRELKVKLLSTDEFKQLSLKFAKAEAERLMGRLGYKSIRQAMLGCNIPHSVSMDSPTQAWRFVANLVEHSLITALSQQLKVLLPVLGYEISDPSLVSWLKIRGGRIEDGRIVAASKHLKELIELIEAK